MFLALDIIFLLSKSAPLDIWAFIILSVSSSKVGINLKAIVIIIASSWAGKPNFLSGAQAFSIPSVKDIGDVVRVNIDVPATNRISLKAIKIAVLIPFAYIFIKPRANKRSPPLIKKMFITKVKRIIHLSGFIPLAIYLIGIFAILDTTYINKNINAYG